MAKSSKGSIKSLGAAAKSATRQPAVAPGAGSNQPNLRGLSRSSSTRRAGSPGAIKFGGKP